MNDFMVKTGANSIILGKGYYGKYVTPKKNMLLKVVKRAPNHDEFRCLSYIQEIKNYNKYYSIPEQTKCEIIYPYGNFYNLINRLMCGQRRRMFLGNLECYYIDDAGEKDMLDTIGDMMDHHINNPVWKSWNDILKFSRRILEGISYLHDKKICHLDIKPENIVYNSRTKQFKIIDFGFAALEPFKNYIDDPKGTPGYFPKQFDFDQPTEWLPKIEANDFVMINGIHPIRRNPMLVYRIDSFSFGRLLYFLRYTFEDKVVPMMCFNCSKRKREKVNGLIADLTHNDVYQRITITNALEKYFS